MGFLQGVSRICLKNKRICSRKVYELFGMKYRPTRPLSSRIGKMNGEQKLEQKLSSGIGMYGIAITFVYFLMVSIELS